MIDGWVDGWMDARMEGDDGTRARQPGPPTSRPGLGWSLAAHLQQRRPAQARLGRCGVEAESALVLARPTVQTSGRCRQDAVRCSQHEVGSGGSGQVVVAFNVGGCVRPARWVPDPVMEEL